MSDFLPDYTALPINGAYRPAYRLFCDRPWRLVPKVQPCATGAAAIEAAKAYVRGLMNPEIRVEHATAVEDDLGIEDWRRRREEHAAAEQKAVFGAVIAKGGRSVPVERRRRRA